MNHKRTRAEIHYQQEPEWHALIHQR